MILDVVVGARPNFMKAAALFRVAGAFPSLQLRLVQTGQHAAPEMSDVFLEELGLPAPAKRLACDPGTQERALASVLVGYAEWLAESRPDACVVVGDVNSTLACALAASRAGVRLAHVEAGLRSGDRGMPEEINRILTDALSDVMFTTEPSAMTNLLREGRPAQAIHMVGNVMIDTLVHHLPEARRRGTPEALGVRRGHYAWMTLHRPDNVDDPQRLAQVLELARELSRQVPVVFAVHPRTRARLGGVAPEGLVITPPLPYLDSLSLTAGARLVVTDSGGLQEEAAYLGVPCITVRPSTERPITVELGGNRLVGRDPAAFREAVRAALARPWPAPPAIIPLWEGRAAERILQILASGGLAGP